MSSWMIALMLGTSIFMGLLGLVAFLWGLKGGQFDDKDKMMQGVLFDSVEDLNAPVKDENTRISKKNAKNNLTKNELNSTFVEKNAKSNQ